MHTLNACICIFKSSICMLKPLSCRKFLTFLFKDDHKVELKRVNSKAVL